MGLAGAGLLRLPKVSDPRGNLTFIEDGGPVPFSVARIYYLYDVPGGASRGGHAHATLEQVVIAVSGSFDVVLDQGGEAVRFSLRRADEGLYVPPMVWRELESFSSGSVCLVLASAPYDEDDYFRDRTDYLNAVSRLTW